MRCICRYSVLSLMMDCRSSACNASCDHEKSTHDCSMCSQSVALTSHNMTLMEIRMGEQVDEVVNVAEEMCPSCQFDNGCRMPDNFNDLARFTASASAAASPRARS